MRRLLRAFAVLGEHIAQVEVEAAVPGLGADVDIAVGVLPDETLVHVLRKGAGKGLAEGQGGTRGTCGFP